MWADTLQAAERVHLLQLLVWAATSILTGTAVLAWLRSRSVKSDLLRHFSIQATAWGTVIALIAAGQLPHLAPRDIASATRLDRMLWLEVGLDVGTVAVGVALVALGWRFGRRLKLVGAGMGVVVQGGALALLHLMLAGQISR